VTQVVVLFTCAGQRVDIVTAFGRAGATTLAADVNELAPALYAADRRALVPAVDDPGYVDALRALVTEHDVRLVVPLADLDHLLLAERGDELGALVLLPGPETIRLCEDKYAAHRFFAERGIATPGTWLPDELPDDLAFPVLVKARRGSGSRHIFRADDRSQLEFFLGYAYFTVAYPTSDGDVLKASYMLAATAGWALGFGYALERLRGRAWPVVLAVLAVCAVAELPFLVY